MQTTRGNAGKTAQTLLSKRNWWQTLKEQRYLYLMSIPFMVLVFVFAYVPIWGWTIAFQKYRLGHPFWEQRWVGLDNFISLFQQPRFYLALKNTVGMSILGLLFGFTLPVIFAILLNEVRGKGFKRTVQTISYLPHFVSWVVVANIVYKMLSTDGGPINQLIVAFGHEPIQFMAKENYFWGIVVISDLWKELGWNTIIYLAAITGIDSELYEAAKVDGAGRWRQIWHVTLPGISATISILLILSIGGLMNIGFEKQYQLMNPLVYDSAQVLDLYSLKYGLQSNNFGRGTAIDMAKSLFSFILLFSVNGIFKRRTGESVM